MRPSRCAALALPLLALLAAACGGGSSSSSGGGGASSGGSGGGQYGGTLTLLANSNWGTDDPGKNYTLQGWQMLRLTHDGLVQFRAAGGSAGTELLPDLATSIPKPTDGGKVYTFTLRPGIKYSDGTPLKASDFVTVFKRQFTIPGPANGFYENLIGAEACLKSPSSCDLSKGVVTDDQAGTVSFHLTAADPEFLDKLTLPFAFAVPANTPLKDTGNNPPPGTGAYMWKTYDPQHEAVLVRNPNFKVWNADVQPKGYPDEIDYKFGLSVEAEVTQVENGQADWLYDPPPADRLNELSTQYASQVHVNPLTAEYYFALNVNIPPFNNLQARQAINFAADRNAYVKIFGGPSLAVPTCQVLPPNFPGYQPYCPYTTNPGDGKWHGADLEKAKQLVQESGTKGAKVAVVGTTDEVGKAITEQMVSDLNAIGYNATAKLLSGGIQYGYIQNSDNNVQVGYSQWYQDYPAASDFLNVLYGCGGFHPHSDASPNIAGFCDKSIQAEMDAALTQGVTDPDGANQAWAKVDQEVTDQAPMVQLFNPKLIDFLSKRVSGYQFSPQWYMLISQLSVK
jgi:peptide/nickel transport system substrate-binding protein